MQRCSVERHSTNSKRTPTAAPKPGGPNPEFLAQAYVCMGTNLKDEPHAWVSWPLSGLQRVPGLVELMTLSTGPPTVFFSPTNSARQVATQSLTLRVGGLVV